MSRADVACIQCRRRKIACSKKLPHCTECLIHGRDCCYSRDKRRRVGDDTQLPASSVSTATCNQQPLSQHHLDTHPRVPTEGLPHYARADSTDTRHASTFNSGHYDIQSSPESVFRSSVSSQADHFAATIPDALNDTFWWLASQWQSSWTSDPCTQLPDFTDSFIPLESARDQVPTTTSSGLSSQSGVYSRSSVEDSTPFSPTQRRIQDSGELHQAYKRCLPVRSRWPKLFKALKKLCQTAQGGSQDGTSPFLCLSKLRKQLELDTTTTPHILNLAQQAPNSVETLKFPCPSTAAPATESPHQPSISPHQATICNQSHISPVTQPDTLRCAWTLAAICLADSASALSPIELSPRLGLELHHESDATLFLFSVAWAHCRAGLCGDPVEVMQTYRMMSLAFSRCHKGQELASASVFLGCRAAATMSIHRSATIARLGSTLRQQEALNAFWHLVSQGCHFQAWEGRDMPIDMALVDLPMPDPKASLPHALLPSSSNTAAAESPRSQFLSSSPVFMTRIWTSVAICQTIECHYRQGASLLVPCETRLQVAVPTATKPSQQEQDHVKHTAKALDFCASLLQTREPASAGTKASQLKRFVLMLVRYSRVLLHYPFCRVDRDHRKAAQESISAIIATVLGTLLSLATEGDEDNDANVAPRCNRVRHSDGDQDSDGYSSSSTGCADARGSVATRQPSHVFQPAHARLAKMDRHLLELLAGMSVRSLVLTLALIKHPLLLSASEFASNDDSERQRSDAVLALRALEQLHEHGVVSPSLLRKARKIARRSGGI